MPKISDDVVRAVTDAAKIEDVVGDFVTLRKAGVNMTGLCPFHDDKTDGNFIVRPSTLSPGTAGRNTYHCFVCMRAKEGGGPVDFLMKAEHMTFPDAIRYLGKKYSIPVDDVPLNWTPPPPRPIPPPKPVMEIPRAYVKRTIDIATWGNITFRNWYMSLPWDSTQRATAHNTLWQYCVGGWRDGRVVFWQIDHDGIPRSAKLMRYEPDGHRYHEKKGEKNQTGWIYNQDGCRQQLKPDEHQIIKPLFGSHLLKRYPQADVNIVESEKTALIMANYYGSWENQIWLACGGLKFMSLEAMQPLIDQGRRVWLWPDKDGVEAWQEVADKLGSDRVQVYTKFFDACWTPEDGDKADCADIALRMMHDPTFHPRKTEPIQADGQGATEQIAAAGLSHGATLPEKPDGVTDSEWFEHLSIMKAIGDYEIVHPGLADEPFLDPEEMADPRLHQLRNIFRNLNKPNR